MRSLLALTLLVGCANVPEIPKAFTGEDQIVFEDDDADTSESRPSRTEADDDDGYEAQTPPTDTTPRKFWARDHDQEWFGEAASTTRVPFGGGKWCNYQVMLTDLRLRVTFDDEGRVIASSFDNLMNETAASCDALGQQSNRFTMPTASPREDLTLSLSPAPENLPQSNVKVTLEPIDANRVTARIFVQRTGGVEPVLNWKLDTIIELTPL